MPTARPLATRVVAVYGLLGIALGVVTVRDLAVARGWSAGTPWYENAVNGLDGLTSGGATTAAGTVIGVIGLVALICALLPARRTHDRTDATPGLWLSRPAIAMLAERAAERTPGVYEASATVHRRRVVVKAAGADEEAATRVEDAVRRALDGVTGRRIVVKRTEVEVP
ncbi:hypothetical protein BHE97_13050 [Aeromicrobium sp. PE09-221]|nr:hypothetical protein BHE97_13050 [Aeromicrobium sp. PE09-221]